MRQVRAKHYEEWRGVIVLPGDVGTVVDDRDPDDLGRVLVLWLHPVRASWCNPEMLEEV